VFINLYKSFSLHAKSHLLRRGRCQLRAELLVRYIDIYIYMCVCVYRNTSIVYVYIHVYTCLSTHNLHNNDYF